MNETIDVLPSIFSHLVVLIIMVDLQDRLSLVLAQSHSPCLPAVLF